MRVLPPGLQSTSRYRRHDALLVLAHHAERRRGTRFHRPRPRLSFDGTSFEAATGFTATEIAGAVGLNVDNLDVEGALHSDRLSEADLVAGLFDNALIEIYRVNWADLEQRVLMRYGSLGEVARGEQLSARGAGARA